MKKVIVVADRAHLRVLRIQSDDLTDEPEHLVEMTGELANLIPGRISEVVTDQKGRFARGGASGRDPGATTGERHGLESEMERQYLVHLADRIDAAVTRSSPDLWVLAAPKAILARLVDELPPKIRESLCETVAGDLTRVPIRRLEKRFLTKAAS